MKDVLSFLSVDLDKLADQQGNYNDITLDVIKRGPLPILLSGLTIACLTQAIQLLSKLKI